jgi:hydrogenase-1 operon protein HyaF
MSLKDIPIAVQAGPAQAEDELTEMAQALLRELADHLESIAQEGGRHVVELTNLPITPQDIILLDRMLGTGEVTATVHASGDTEIRETHFPGLWWVRYLGSEGNLITQQLEIAATPLILEAHADDMRASADAVRKLFDQRQSPNH